MAYQVKTENFEGPIELLLELAKKSEIDIYGIWISKITTQYLEYIAMIQSFNLDEALEFLVIAASLIYLKSRSLLPQETIELVEEEEKLRRSLESYAQEYERFREVADHLKEKAIVASNYFTRPVPEELKKEEYIEATLFDLVSAFKSILIESEKKENIREITREVITVEQKMEEILNLLQEENAIIQFSRIFKNAMTRLEIVVSFLALLELIRSGKIRAVQKKLFEEIELVRI
jgi:segregation and condensation protein A